MRTGLVMFEWHALGHVPMSASYMRPGRRSDDGLGLVPHQPRSRSSATATCSSTPATPGPPTRSATRTGADPVAARRPPQLVHARSGRPLRLAARRDAAAERRRSRSSTTRTRRRSDRESRGDRRRPQLHDPHGDAAAHATSTPIRRCSRRARATSRRSPTATGCVGLGQVGLVSEFSPRGRADLRAGAAAVGRVLPRLPLPVGRDARARSPRLAASRAARRDARPQVAASWNGATVGRRLAGARRRQRRRRSARSARRCRAPASRPRSPRRRPPRPTSPCARSAPPAGRSRPRRAAPVTALGVTARAPAPALARSADYR